VEKVKNNRLEFVKYTKSGDIYKKNVKGFAPFGFIQKNYLMSHITGRTGEGIFG